MNIQLKPPAKPRRTLPISPAKRRRNPPKAPMSSEAVTGFWAPFPSTGKGLGIGAAPSPRGDGGEDHSALPRERGFQREKTAPGFLPLPIFTSQKKPTSSPPPAADSASASPAPPDPSPSQSAHTSPHPGCTSWPTGSPCRTPRAAPRDCRETAPPGTPQG